MTKLQGIAVAVAHLKVSIVVVHNPATVLVRFRNPITLTHILLLRPARRVEIWPLSLYSYTNSVASVRREAVGCGVVLYRTLAYCSYGWQCWCTYGSPVIPKRYISLVPLKSHMYLRTRRNDLVQQADNVVRLCLRDTNDLCDETWIEKDRLPARDWVRSDEGVFGCDGLAADCAAKVPGALGLQFGGVQRCE
jgi:hypothetical protein